MGKKKKKISARRQHVRNNMSAERLTKISKIANSRLPWALLILLIFSVLTVALISIESTEGRIFQPNAPIFMPWPEVISVAAIVLLVALGMSIYIYHYEPQVIHRPGRMVSMTGLFLVLLLLIKTASTLWPEYIYVAAGSSVTIAIIMTIAYNQRFAIGMAVFFSVLGCFAADRTASMELFLTMIVGSVTCSFSLKEIRTRLKLMEVTTFASVTVLITAAAMGALSHLPWQEISYMAGSAAGITLFVGMVINAFLPLIERIFNIATSMTLLDYSDANQPLLRKLAMEAPGTFSHSLLIGSIAEAAADAIGANGLLCRVGAYYHDVGKINKPPYFAENQMGQASRHEQLSPAMSQLVIVGHVKDGIEVAKEYGLPPVLRQFIATHHGTTLIEYFYDQAKKKQSEKGGTVSESEFRYPGPKPQTREAAIVMIADACESAVRSLNDPTPTRIEAVVHNMAMKRLQDGQFDECDLTLKELSKIEAAMTKNLSAHHHGRVPYPKSPDQPAEKPGAQRNGGGKPHKDTCPEGPDNGEDRENGEKNEIQSRTASSGHRNAVFGEKTSEPPCHAR